MKRIVKRKYIVSILSLAIVVFACFLWHENLNKQENKIVKVGFIYVGDGANAYTKNFIKAQDLIEETYSGKVQCIAKFNIPEGSEQIYIEQLVKEGCEIIFGTSYGYQEAMKEAAKKHPDIEFCQATGANSDDPKVDNYHTYMGHIYEGRYIAGVVAGMKLKEHIDTGKISADQALIGYVGAYDYAEVISGYTAFFMGVRSCVPEAKMKVKYTYSWSNYALEKEYAQQLIDEGCVIISQHSDTRGPAVACENAVADHPVYHIGYNQSMIDIAPTTSLTGCRINWAPYELAAVKAMIDEKNIESVQSKKVTINGNDAGAGFIEGWVEMLDLNEVILAKGTKDAIDQKIKELKSGKISVFKGNYTGVNPYDEKDVYDLSKGFEENKNSSAPAFNYVLKDVIVIE